MVTIVICKSGGMLILSSYTSQSLTQRIRKMYREVKDDGFPLSTSHFLSQSVSVTMNILKKFHISIFVMQLILPRLYRFPKDSFTIIIFKVSVEVLGWSHILSINMQRWPRPFMAWIYTLANSNQMEKNVYSGFCMIYVRKLF
jgi:hypothetical protein